MKKLTLIFFSILVLCTIIGCNSSSKEQKQVKTDESANDTLSESGVSVIPEDSLYLGFEEYFTKVFNEHLYEDEGFIERYCTDKFIAKLKAAYEYEGGGYATWLFRSDSQDGPSEEYGLTNITKEGDGWYKYDFVDMGNHGSHRIKVIAHQTPRGNVEFYFDEIE